MTHDLQSIIAEAVTHTDEVLLQLNGKSPPTVCSTNCAKRARKRRRRRRKRK